MLDKIFDINEFNVVQDENNFYFFRALSNGDYDDIQNGITLENGVVKKIRTDLERYPDVPLYREDDQISLEEVHDHVKWIHRKDTNCISLSTNANVATTYGKGNYSNQYTMITVPKDRINDSGFYISGKFLIDEIQNRIQKMIDGKFLDDIKINFLKLVDEATNNEELFNILEQYSNTNNYNFNKNKFYDYLTLNEEQNLEKNKIIAKLDIINRRLLSRCSNRLLVESIKFAFTSSEVIHYKSIEENFSFVSPTAIDLFSLLQQAKSMGLDSNKVNFLEQKILQCVKNGLYINNGRFGNYNTIINDYIRPDRNVRISDIYNLTGGRIPYSKAYKALLFSQDIADSKLKTNDLCNLLKEIVNDEQYNSLIDEIKSKCYVINPSFVSRNMQEGLRLSDSVCLSMNTDRERIFSSQEQNLVLNYITSLSREQQIEFINKNGLENEQVLCDLLHPKYIDNITPNRYYAETIIDYLNLDEIYNASYLQKTLSDEEKESLISYLNKANCINMFDSLSELGIEHSTISGIIFNLLLNNGYQGYNFIDLSNSSDFKNIIANNLNNLNSKVSAIRLDYLLGIRDNNNYVPTSNINLRDYQQLAVDRTNEIFETKNFAGVVLPTGAGKSFIAITEMLKYKDQNIIYYAPNKEILRQLQKHILKYVLNITVIPESQETYYLEHSDRIPEGYVFQSDIEDIISIAFPQLNMYCYQGLTTKEEEFFEARNAGLIILDEVHRTGAQKWNEKIKILVRNNPNAKILGITATPIRDVDNQNMVEKLAEFSGTYTEEEIKKKKYMAAEMYLVDAMQEGIVVTPNIVTFDYSLENSEQYKEVKRMYENESNPYKKEELKKIYDEMRRIIEVSQKKGMAKIIKEGFEKNHKPMNGRYIVFLPTNSNGQISTEEYILEEIEKVKEYFKEIDPNPEVEYLLSNRKSKSENSTAISRFENDSEHLKLIFAINMLNEGVHVAGIDGVIMLRPLNAGSKILYYQQIGRCIYSLDPNYELEPSEFPVIFDVYNNYLEQNMDRQVNRHTVTSDLQKLYLIREWINKHFRYPDINSESLDEARKAITLKRIQKKYFKYLDNPTYNSNLSDSEIYEIQEIINIGKNIELWNIGIPDRIVDPKEKEIEQFATFKLKGEQKEFVDLFRQASKITTDKGAKSKQLRLIDVLNILDILAEYDIEINNSSIPYGSILQNIYSTIPEDILELIKKEIPVDIGYELGAEYNEAKKQFYKKNPIFLDYDVNILRKMGIFEPCNIYKGFKDIDIVDDNGFIIHGPTKFLRLNIYTGTYFSPKGLNIEGLDEQNFSHEDGFFNKYGFGRDGYYYELTDTGEHIKTESIYNPYGFDIKGDYYQIQQDGTYKNLGKINLYGFDKDGIFYRYNKITKEYVKTNSSLDDRGFDKDGIFCTTGESVGYKTKELEFNDGITRTFENVSYMPDVTKVNRSSKFITDLPYDLNYFDREGYYYILDENGNRIKSNLRYNERYLDAEGYYYELQPDGTRKRTDRMYDDNNYGLDGYYYELQQDGSRKKTDYLQNTNGINYLGLRIKYTFNEKLEKKKKYVAFDQDGYCYEYVKIKFVKMEPATKISKYGFDVNGYYHELLPDGTRNEIPSDRRLDIHGFDECGIYKEKSIRNEFGFSQDGYYWKKKGSYGFSKTNSKTDENGFDIDGLYEIKTPTGELLKRPYNNRFLSRDGYYYKRIQNPDGSFSRFKTNKKVDARGFDLNGMHYDVYINNTTKEFVYRNPKPYDKFGFDVEGIYYEHPKITYKSGGERKIEQERVKSKPPRIYNEYGFNYKGLYCEVDGQNVVVTDSKYNPYGFDILGFYKELDSKGEKTIFDPNGFTIDGKYSTLNPDGTRTVTETYNDPRGFTQEDYMNYQKGIIKVDKYGFDLQGKYIDSSGVSKGITNEYGFDVNGYYHELLPDGTRDLSSTNKKINSRGFDIDKCYHESEDDIMQKSKYRRGIKVDPRGFDIDGLYEVNGEKIPCDERQFGLDGCYYEKQEDGYTKTNRKYNSKGFDIDGYYWKLIDGEYKNTNQKYDDNGFDCHGFNKEGIHNITKLNYDERYFKQDGINIITGTEFSLTGYNINGRFFKNRISAYAKTHMYNRDDQELECIYIAKRALSLSFDKRDRVLDDIPSESRNKKVLTDLLYKNIVAAAVIDPEVKDMLIDYIKKLSDEIKALSDKIKIEKAKAIRDELIIKEYEKKLASYREMQRKTMIGDNNGRNI